MKRRWMAAALIAALSGCGETDPDKINSAGITGEKPANAPTSQAPNKPAGMPTGDTAAQKAEAEGEETATDPTAAASGRSGGDHVRVPEGYPGTEAPKPADETAPKPEAVTPEGTAPKEEAPKTAAVTLSDEELAEVKKLPENEQALAIAQGVCMVSGEHLGSMGMPFKVEHDGKTAYLCCKGCKKDFDADPAGMMAKLAK